MSKFARALTSFAVVVTLVTMFTACGGGYGGGGSNMYATPRPHPTMTK
jgi:hypothetical protein